MGYKERDYGMPFNGETGTPKATPLDAEMAESVRASGGCPNCGCLEVMEVTVPVSMDILAGGKGLGKYLGCPACPWASPMIAMAQPPQ